MTKKETKKQRDKEKETERDKERETEKQGRWNRSGRSGNCPTNISAYTKYYSFYILLPHPHIIKLILHMWAGKSLQ